MSSQPPLLRPPCLLHQWPPSRLAVKRRGLLTSSQEETPNINCNTLVQPQGARRVCSMAAVPAEHMRWHGAVALADWFASRQCLVRLVHCSSAEFTTEEQLCSPP